MFPSTTETFGNVTPEAMASGLPVVAYDHAAAGQLIRHGHNGLLVPFGHTALFVAQAVAAALNPAQALQLGHCARQTALQHGWGQIVGQVEAILHQAWLQASPAGHALAVTASQVAGTMAGHADRRPDRRPEHSASRPTR